MKEYHKIQTIYKRDRKSNKIIEGDWTLPEFEMLKDIKWTGTEKIDGTNIRVIWDGFTVTFKGRTDRAQIPGHLLSSLIELFPIELMAEHFGEGRDENFNLREVCLYGEGYGMKIQKGGNYLPYRTDFCLFDIRIGNWWLTRDSIEDLAHVSALNLKIAPVIGEFTLQEAVEFVRKGFKSTMAANIDYDAEGLVLKPKHELFMRNGQRIVTKIKSIDFR